MHPLIAAENVIHAVEGEHFLSMQDISNWQGEKPDVSQHEILAIKASEGNFFLDPEFGDNWIFAKTHEKARVAYHFLHPSIPGLQQAQFFLDQVSRYGLENGDMFAVDAETTDGQPVPVFQEVIKEFCDYLHAQTKAIPFAYSNIFTIQAGNLDTVSSLPLWIADPSSPPGHPRVPHPFEGWLIHQYGIIRGIDADVVNATSVNQLAKYGALISEPEPPPDIVTMTLTDGHAVTTHEFHESLTVKELRGYSANAGDAKLDFSK